MFFEITESCKKRKQLNYVLSGTKDNRTLLFHKGRIVGQLISCLPKLVNLFILNTKLHQGNSIGNHYLRLYLIKLKLSTANVKLIH